MLWRARSICARAPLNGDMGVGPTLGEMHGALSVAARFPRSLCDRAPPERGARPAELACELALGRSDEASGGDGLLVEWQGGGDVA